MESLPGIGSRLCIGAPWHRVQRSRVRELCRVYYGIFWRKNIGVGLKISLGRDKKIRGWLKSKMLGSKGRYWVD